MQIYKLFGNSKDYADFEFGYNNKAIKSNFYKTDKLRFWNHIPTCFR